MAGCPRWSGSPAPIVLWAPLQMKTLNPPENPLYLYEFSKCKKVIKLSNAGKGKFYIQDLGRIMLLGNAFIFFFLVLSLVPNKSETY